MILFEISREAFLPFLVLSFLVGIFLGALYDVFRIRRKALRALGRRLLDFILTLFEDIAFCTFAAVCLILVSYKTYFGIPRWYSYVSAAMGFFLWQRTVGRLVMSLSDRMIALISAVLSFIKRRLISPIIGAAAGLFLALHRKYAHKRALRYTKKREEELLLLIKK